MPRLPLLVLLATLAAGCDVIDPTRKCLTSDVGCELPGTYRLVSVDGEAAEGALTISSGQFERDGSLDLPTGDATYPRLFGPYLGSVPVRSDQAGNPSRFELRASMEDGGALVTAYFDTSASVDGDLLTLRVRSLDARYRAGAASRGLRFPRIDAGAVLVFRRQEHGSRAAASHSEKSSRANGARPRPAGGVKRRD